MTKRRRRFTFSLGVLVALVLLFFVAAPGITDRSMNKVSQAPAAVPPEASALHRTLTWVDLHADSLLWGRDLLQRQARGHVDLPRLVDGNVAVQMFTIVTQSPRHLNIDRNDDRTDNIRLLAIAQRWPAKTWSSLPERALYQAERFANFAGKSDGKLTAVRTSAELDAFLDRRRSDPTLVAGILGIEGAHALGPDLGALDRLDAAGIRMISFTHFFDNPYGGSASGVNKGGLTGTGKKLLAEMERRGILVDLSHTSHQVISDVLALAKKPVVASHTGVRGTCDNNRNLTDDELRGIAATGGLIAIAYFANATCGNKPEDIARAVAYTVKIVGADHVALGSDFDGAVATPFDTAHLSTLTAALLAAGISAADLHKIAGDNTIALLRKTLP